jgi:hypothetical protein
MAFGTMWAVNYVYPGNVLFLIIAFMLWLAVAIILFTMKKK